MKSAVEIDFYQHISLQMKAFKMCGFWFFIPYPKKSIMFWFGILNRIFLGVFFFIIPTGGQLVYVIRLIMSGKAEIQEIAGIINLIFTELSATLKLLDLRLRRNLLMEIVKQLNSEEFNCYTESSKRVLEKAIQFSRGLFWGLLISCTIDVAIHVLVVPGLNKFESLPLKMDLVFFDVNSEPYFKYICFYQIIYKPMMLLTFVIHQTLPWAAMCFTISQLDVLIYNIKNMKELVKARVERRRDENEAFNEVLKRCVIHHSSIMRFVKTLQATFGGQFTVTLFLNAGIVCTTAVQIFSIQSPLKNLTDVSWVLTFLNIFITILFIDCYFGNIITVKCEKVSSVVYACPWTNLSKDLKRNVSIFIARTQQPVIITAARLVPVSLETFTKVMNWTYKGFAVMNQMKK
ncbi:hypothetical protein K1T71_009258 [Dendrolimus kikuchii]|uniref:Uncharacterized protein n=1 Tax=Dendrolimus kikuchii TaxID=765133 RepID=A0ACC1CVM3_9NEOP|nr:hypothetical protein K1T71_009258 [Dendrolimus kikuchii]